jgi:hypothetical protein
LLKTKPVHTHQPPPKMSSAEDLLAMFSTMKTTDHSTLISQFCTVRLVLLSLTTHCVECSRGRHNDYSRHHHFTLDCNRRSRLLLPTAHERPPHSTLTLGSTVRYFTSLLAPNQVCPGVAAEQAAFCLEASNWSLPVSFPFFKSQNGTSWCNITLLSRLLGPFRKRSPLRLLVF